MFEAGERKAGFGHGARVAAFGPSVQHARRKRIACPDPVDNAGHIAFRALVAADIPSHTAPTSTSSAVSR